MTMHPFARDNRVFLQQGRDLLTGIGDEHYAATLPPVYTSSAGAHIRHILDHFYCLLSGLDSGKVDYDDRQRDGRLEHDRSAAIEAIDRLRARLGQLTLAHGEQPLRIRVDGGGAGDTALWSASSVARELQFLVSHTIHHYALVAAILRAAGCTPQPGFGVSPSTLAFQRLAVAR